MKYFFKLRKIPEVVQTVKIIVFGSKARGKMHANSDIDLFVVTPSKVHLRKTA